MTRWPWGKRCPGRGDGYGVVGVLPEGDDDVVAGGFELASGVAGLAAAVGVPGVPAGAEVAVAGGGVTPASRLPARAENFTRTRPSPMRKAVKPSARPTVGSDQTLPPRRLCWLGGGV